MIPKTTITKAWVNHLMPAWLDQPSGFDPALSQWDEWSAHQPHLLRLASTRILVTAATPAARDGDGTGLHGKAT